MFSNFLATHQRAETPLVQVANMRHNALFRRFISALARGGPGGLPRPIEVHAHDPLRYVGDMLGWLHQVRHLVFQRFILPGFSLILPWAFHAGIGV